MIRPIHQVPVEKRMYQLTVDGKPYGKPYYAISGKERCVKCKQTIGKHLRVAFFGSGDGTERGGAILLCSIAVFTLRDKK
jgi:hypothetical protein